MTPSPRGSRGRRVPPGPLPAGLNRQALVDEVTRALAPLEAGAAALVAVSGGPDSTALVALAQEARPDVALTLGHIRHGLRDDRADVAAVQELSAALGLALRVSEVTVRPSGHGLEAAARVARYAALARLGAAVVADRDGPCWLLVGHTADDQAETLLLRLARGTGLTGLGGMAPVRGHVVRPLLRVRRSDVRRFVTLEGLHAVEDPTNLDLDVRRVRVRDHVVPGLQAVASDPIGALARLADLARVDAGYLESEAARVAAAVVRPYGPARAVTTEDLLALDPAIGGRLVRRLLGQVRASDVPVTAAHVAAVLDLEAGSAVDVPGATVTRGGGWIAAVPADVPRPSPVDLEVPGTATWSCAGLLLRATVAGSGPGGQLPLSLDLPWKPPSADTAPLAIPPGGDPALAQLVLPAAVTDPALIVRGREPGDRVATAAGTRKLQDLFVDAGVPRAVRDLVPVVVASDGTILWVPGVVADAAAAAAGREAPAVELAVEI
ncbi:MAG: tRNA lysidine(34) synthetase TilS [Actinobacteria bacterium]|nr:tRNA lysidine(34) synthetase TilS [Actinomycetota bacterium]